MSQPTEPEHLGEVGEKVTLAGVVRAATRVNGFTAYAPDRALIVIDAGTAVAKLVTSARWAYAIERGDQITVTGTVKAHTEWRGIKQTVLTRATRTDTSKPPPAESQWEAVNVNEAEPRPFPGQANPLAPTPNPAPGPRR